MPYTITFVETENVTCSFIIQSLMINSTHINEHQLFANNHSDYQYAAVKKKNQTDRVLPSPSPLLAKTDILG